MDLIDRVLMRLFGTKENVRFEAVTLDGRKLPGTVEIESHGMTKARLEAELQNILWVRHGIRTRSLTIVGVSQ
jgi:hypothetical protein